MERVADTLFGKTRQAVLAKLFLDPEREFRLREISRLVEISSGSVQHELRQLVKADLVRRSERNGLVTYRANAASPIFAELRSIVEKTSGIGELVRKALAPAADSIRLAFIYGSIAKGGSTSRSDVDVLVVGTVKFGELVGLLAPVEEKIGREVSPRLFSEKEFNARLKRGDRFLTSVMRGAKIMLIGGADEPR